MKIKELPPIELLGWIRIMDKETFLAYEKDEKLRYRYELYEDYMWETTTHSQGWGIENIPNVLREEKIYQIVIDRLWETAPIEYMEWGDTLLLIVVE